MARPEVDQLFEKYCNPSTKVIGPQELYNFLKQTQDVILFAYIHLKI